jgi:hypothetical protein
MQFVQQPSVSGHVSSQQVGVVPNVNSNITETTSYEMWIDSLRKAIRKNAVSFPSQVPTFPKYDRPDVHQKLSQLYFVLGWSSPKIGARCGLGRLRVHQILNTWMRRAVEAGFIQAVPPAGISKLLFKHPIQVVLSPVNRPAAPIMHCSTPCEISDRADSRKGYSPPQTLVTGQIVGVLKKIEAGRTVTVADMADEVGVSTSTIRTWRRQREIRLLRRENTQLKEQIGKLGASKATLTSKATLISPITISDRLPRRAFMPC